MFESFAEHEDLVSICAADAADQTALFGAKYIETDRKRGARARLDPEKMGLEAQDLLERAFHLSAAAGKAYVAFMRLGYRVGAGCGMLADPSQSHAGQGLEIFGRGAPVSGVSALWEYGDVLIAQIEPKKQRPAGHRAALHLALFRRIS